MHRSHTASPVTMGKGNAEEDQKEVIDPAVNGSFPQQLKSLRLFCVWVFMCQRYFLQELS